MCLYIPTYLNQNEGNVIPASKKITQWTAPRDAKNDFVHAECSFLQTTNPYDNAQYLAKNDLINGLKKIAVSVEGNKKISPRFHLGLKPKLAIDPNFNIFSIKPNIIHNGNAKAIISVGGANSPSSWATLMQAANRSAFIHTTKQFLIQ